MCGCRRMCWGWSTKDSSDRRVPVFPLDHCICNMLVVVKRVFHLAGDWPLLLLLFIGTVSFARASATLAPYLADHSGIVQVAVAGGYRRHQQLAVH